jgi:hypothetical protein
MSAFKMSDLIMSAISIVEIPGWVSVSTAPSVRRHKGLSKTRDELDISLKMTIETKQSLDTSLGVRFKIVLLTWFICLAIFFTEIMYAWKCYFLNTYLRVQALIASTILQVQKRLGIVLLTLRLGLYKIPCRKIVNIRR